MHIYFVRICVYNVSCTLTYIYVYVPNWNIIFLYIHAYYLLVYIFKNEHMNMYGPYTANICYLFVAYIHTYVSEVKSSKYKLLNSYYETLGTIGSAGWLFSIRFHLKTLPVHTVQKLGKTFVSIIKTNGDRSNKITL